MSSPCFTKGASSLRARPRSSIGATTKWCARSCGPRVQGEGGDPKMISSRAVGAGAFVVIGLLLFAVGLFMIGERRMLFEKRLPVYTELKKLGQLEIGATVRVAGANAGEVTDIQLPVSPSGTFRVKMEVREALHPIIRTDSVAATQTEGLVGGIFVNIAAGSEQASPLPEGGTIRGREPFQLSDLLQQASDTITT